METDPKINLYHTDCMNFMAGVPDNYYELAIVDPPYGIGEDGEKIIQGGIKQNQHYTLQKHGIG